MSSSETPTADTTNEAEKSGDKTSNETNESTNTSQNNNKPIKKVKSKKDLKNDASRFDPPGVNFNAKLIGIDDVEHARGDKMCQESMYRLKIAVKQSGQHKPKLIVNVSVDGIRIIDLRTHAVNHTHPVHRISFISRDITDHRAFGYVFGAGEGKHKFFAIKTEKAAEALVLTLRDLFQVVYEMKKKEVEDAKHKIEEPATETGTEATENKEEPVYSVPTNGKPVQDETDSTYQVPNNNKPVQDEAPDLLQMETELQTIERRIEQIDTMEELFKELEAPPTTTQAAPTPSGGAWSSDLAGLSQTQTQPAFSVGGMPFPTTQSFPAPSANPFPTAAPTFGPGAQQFGQPAFPQSGFPPQQTPGMQQPGMQQPGMQQFQVPMVPPRTAPGFPGQTAQFPGTPFAPQQPGFMGAVPPGMPGMPAPPTAVTVTPASDPFGIDPFAGNGMEENLLTPAVLQTTEEEPATQPKQADVFGDLVNMGGATKKQTLSPKEMFVDLATPAKRSLNELKVDKAPSPKSTSPVGFQASGETENQTTETFNPFGTSDPFANDPFSSTGPAQTVSHINPDAFGNNVFGDDDDFTLPLPQGPPPPLPDHIASQSLPLPPPRAIVEPNNFPQDMPPVPPRPMSASSDSKNSSGSLSSLNESQQMTPPLPPRPENRIVPRPRPRPSKTQNISNTVGLPTNTQKSSNQNVVLKSPVINKGSDGSLKQRLELGKLDSSEKISNSGISDSVSFTNQSRNKESHSGGSALDNSLTKGRTSSVVVADPFVATDPFASDDPFIQSDPFANDPFNPDPFTETSDTQPARKDDPFTTVVTHKHDQPTDPFSVFDNTVSNDNFKFEKSTSRKTKTKVSG